MGGKTPFQEACRRDNQAFAALLLSKGADPDARDGSGMTALMEAVDGNRPDMARWLLETAGADPVVRDDSGNTALHMAVKARNSRACSLLLSAGADIHARNAAGETPFLAALGYGREGLPWSSCGHGQAPGLRRPQPCTKPSWSKPHAGAESDLIARGTPVNARDKDGRTPHFHASGSSQFEVPHPVQLAPTSGAHANAKVPSRSLCRSGWTTCAPSCQRGSFNAWILGERPPTRPPWTGQGGGFLAPVQGAARLVGTSRATASELAANRGFTALAADLPPVEPTPLPRGACLAKIAP
jgi:hypothetical protein